MATFNKSVLDAVLRSRSLSRETLSARTGVSFGELSSQLEREQGPSRSLIDSIAKELSVPSFVFYMKASPAFELNIPDFRHPNPRAIAKSRSTIESIQIARSIQKEANKLGYFGRRGELPRISVEPANVARIANNARNYFEITIQDQIAAKDTRLFYYLCRQKIEAKEIFVIQDSFPSEDGSGYALADDQCPVIIINSHNQNYSRRLFTLVHELAHVLLRQTGISDPFVRTNATERFCNAFAAEFLVPAANIDDLLRGLSVPRNPNTTDIRRIAQRLKFSQEASVIRLEELGRVAPGSHESWLRAISNYGNPDFKNTGGGGARPAEEKIKLAKYGFLFANAFERAVNEGAVSDIELYRISGIKPRWLKRFFDYAKSADFEGIEDE